MRTTGQGKRANATTQNGIQKPTVFISYSWKNEETAAEIEKALEDKADVRRDKKDINSWDSLTVFMQSIRNQDFAVLIISESYLKSTACLFEVMQLMKDDNWEEKAIYVVLEDAHIYSVLERAEYIEYWSNQYNELNEKTTALPSSSVYDLSQELRKVSVIRDSISEFLSRVADTKNPDLNSVIQAMILRISASQQVSLEDNAQELSTFFSKEDLSIIETAASGEGIIICAPTLSSYVLSINDKEFVDLSRTNGREISSWIAAMDRLVKMGLIEELGYKKEIYKMTQKGYIIADKLSDKKTKIHCVCRSCRYAGMQSFDTKCPVCGSSEIVIEFHQTKG